MAQGTLRRLSVIAEDRKRMEDRGQELVSGAEINSSDTAANRIPFFGPLLSVETSCRKSMCSISSLFLLQRDDRIDLCRSTGRQITGDNAHAGEHRADHDHWPHGNAGDGAQTFR